MILSLIALFMGEKNPLISLIVDTLRRHSLKTFVQGIAKIE